MRKVLIIAHRGASGLAPENTRAAFAKAVEIGADIVEVDVHLCADGDLMVIHDDTVDRVAGNTVQIPGTGRAVKRMTAEELKALDVGSWFSPEFSGQRIPTLREALELLKGKCSVIIEIKKGSESYKGIEGKVLEVVRSLSMEKDILISSFELPALKEVRKKVPDTALGIIFNTDTWDYVFKSAAKLHALSLYPDKSLVTIGWIDKAHSFGIKVYPYTVNEEEEMKTLIQMGVDGLVTNRPDILKALLHT